jgi:hypothetical protein
MSTVIDELKKGGIPDFIYRIAKDEGIDPKVLCRPHHQRPCSCLPQQPASRIRSDCNRKGHSDQGECHIGTSPTLCDFEEEIER